MYSDPQGTVSVLSSQSVQVPKHLGKRWKTIVCEKDIGISLEASIRYIFELESVSLLLYLTMYLSKFSEILYIFIALNRIIH